MREGRTASLLGLWVPLAVASAFLVAHAFVFDFVTDDAFISFVYSRNLARHGELVFNLGERVEGYTNFLWTVWLGLLYKLGLAPEVMSRLFGILSSIGTIYVVLRIGELLSGRRTPWNAIAPLCLAAWGGFACWSSGGLESGLFTFLCTLGIWRYLVEEIGDDKRVREGWRSLVWRTSSIFFALASLTRPEGTLVFGAVGLHKLGVLALSRRLPRRDEIVWVAMYLAVFGPFFAWRWGYYGYPFPNTYYIKSAGGSGTVERGVYYLRRFTEQSHAWAAAGFVLVAAAAGLAWRERARRLFHSLALLVIAVYFYYVAKVGGDFMGLYRFVMPTFPLLALLVQDGIVALWDALPRRTPAVAALFGVALAAGATAHGHQMVNTSHHAIRWVGADNGIDSPGFLRKYTRDRATIGKWFFTHGRRDDYMSVGGAGAQPWYADMRALDAFGLSDEFIAHKVRAHSNRPGHQKWAPDDYVFRRRPTILCHVYQLTNHPQIDDGRLAYFAREGYYFVTVRIPKLPDHYTFAVLLTDRGAPFLHGAELEKRLTERLLLDDELVRVWIPPGSS